MTLQRHHNALPHSAVWRCVLTLFVAGSLTGCAAFHPIRGVPAPYVPHEYLGPSRSGKKTIDLSLLAQTPPDQYRVAAKDTLAIYIPGVLGSLNVEEERQIGETPPINISNNPADPPTIGYPITVRDDGTIALPYIDPVNVHGMTLPQIEIAVRRAYTEQTHVLNGERDRVLVSLQRRREVSVIVVRQETSSELTQGAQPGTLNIGNSKRGTARTVRLPAYENDVLHALANSQVGSDGLPGLDAKNTIYVIRRKKSAGGLEFAGGLCSHPSFSHHGAAPPVTPQPPIMSAPYGQVTPGAVQPTPVTSPLMQPQPTIIPSPAGQNDLEPLPLPSADEQDRRPPDRGAANPTPEPEPSPSVIEPTPTPPPATVPQTRKPAPAWPAPAVPPKSIQRASGPQPERQRAAAWPIIRGQSPTQGYWGHGDVSHPGFGHAGFQPITAPSMYGQPMGPYQAHPQPAYTQPYGAMAGIIGHDDSWNDIVAGTDLTVDNPNVIKIPVRLSEGERPMFSERDIILEDGDIVFIESRETEVFYTGGLLGGGQYTLPRDYDLRVLEAISIAQSPQNNTQTTGRAIGGVSALNQDVTISASHVVILRSLPNGTRIPIEVDLYKAVRRPQENILIQPGDIVILQYTKLEAIGAFLERHLLEGAIFGIAASYAANPANGN